MSIEIINKCINTTSTLIEFFNIYTKEVFEYYAKNKEALIIIASFYTAIGDGPASLRHDTFEAKHCILDDLLLKKIKEGIKNKEIRKINHEYLYQLYHGLLFPYIANLVFMNKLVESEISQHVNFILDVIFNGILVK
jgi:hypothetical protein